MKILYEIFKPPKGVWRPGMKICGIAGIDVQENENITTVVLTLNGAMKVKCTPKKKSTSRAELEDMFFIKQSVLYTGPRLPLGPYDWSFEFDVPSSALPPTTQLLALEELSTNKSGMSCAASIEYWLAVGTSPSSYVTKDAEIRSRKALHISSVRSIRLPARDSLIYNALLTFVGKASDNPFQNKLRVFRNSRDLGAGFRLCLEQPSIAVVHEPLHVKVKVVPEMDIVNFPGARLRSVSATLTCKVKVRTESADFESNPDLPTRVEFAKSIDLIKSQPPDVGEVLLTAEPTDLSHVYGDMFIPSAVSPTHKGHRLISITYELRIHIDVDCNGKTYRTDAHKPHPIEILPHEYVSEDENQRQPERPQLDQSQRSGDRSDAEWHQKFSDEAEMCFVCGIALPVSHHDRDAHVDNCISGHIDSGEMGLPVDAEQVVTQPQQRKLKRSILIVDDNNDCTSIMAHTYLQHLYKTWPTFSSTINKLTMVKLDGDARPLPQPVILELLRLFRGRGVHFRYQPVESFHDVHDVNIYDVILYTGACFDSFKRKLNTSLSNTTTGQTKHAVIPVQFVELMDQNRWAFDPLNHEGAWTQATSSAAERLQKQFDVVRDSCNVLLWRYFGLERAGNRVSKRPAGLLELPAVVPFELEGDYGVDLLGEDEVFEGEMM